MDPVTAAITTAIIIGVSSGLSKAGEQFIVDAYGKLKSMISKRLGEKSEVVKAISDLELKPESEGRKQILQEEIVLAEIDKDPDILEVAKTLLKLLEYHSPETTTIVQTNYGDNPTQIGQIKGDVTINR